MSARDKAELELVRTREERLARPLGELVGVVFELSRNHRAALGLDLLAVVDARNLRVEFVKRLDGEQSLGTGFVIRHAVQAVPRNERDPVAHVPLTVAVANLRGARVVRAEGIGVGSKLFVIFREHLLGVVKVATRGLLAELVDAVDVILVILDHGLRRLGHREEVKVTLGSLIHDQRAVFFGHDEIPSVHRPRRAHHRGDHVIRGVHRAALLSHQVRHDRIVGSGRVHRVLLALLKIAVELGGDAIVRLVEVREGPATHELFVRRRL